MWADNWLSVSVFIRMSTQWRVGMGGATGLDYGVLPAVLRLAGVPPADRSDVFESIRVLEDSALATMRQPK